jgi:hypothetical protein
LEDLRTGYDDDARAQSLASLASLARDVILRLMANSDEKPVIEPFPNKEGTGWHVVIRYHAGHERRIQGFATKAEAVDWITENSAQVDK